MLIGSGNLCAFLLLVLHQELCRIYKSFDRIMRAPQPESPLDPAQLRYKPLFSDFREWYWRIQGPDLLKRPFRNLNDLEKRCQYRRLRVHREHCENYHKYREGVNKNDTPKGNHSHKVWPNHIEELFWNGKLIQRLHVRLLCADPCL